jgi:oxygen-dependent protoporphyrinogen oxidase
VKRVAIIGGGLAGLTCAYALKRRGIDTTVFESAAKPGGRDASVLYLLGRDLFQNTFGLIGDLGLADDVISIPAHAGQAYKGRVYRHRVASAAGLLSFRGLNIADKALLPRMAYLLARYSSRLDFHRPERGVEFDAETVASFVKRELSQNVLNYVAGPLISTLFYYGSDETSALLYLVLAKYMYSVRMSTVRGGIERIAGALSRELNIAAGRSIAAIAMEGRSCIVDHNHFSDVVIAVPGSAVLSIGGLEAVLSGEDRQFFHECKYQRVVSVRVLTDRPVDGGCYAVSIPRVENLSAATISFNDYIDPSSVPAGRGLLTISGGGPNVAVSGLMEDLNKLYRIEPLSVETFEWSAGMPKFPPGRYRQIAAFQARARRPGLFFCGDYLVGPFIEGAVTSGLRAAAAIPD